MTAFDEYMQFLKTAASGERAHEILPGRTSTSRKGNYDTTPTTLPPESVAAPAEPEEKKTKAPKMPPKKPKQPKASTVTVTPEGSNGPKVDINFSVKVGADQTAPQSRNTRARVRSSFTPSGHVGGSYGDEPLLDGGDLMRTPALPTGAEQGMERVGSLQAADELQRALAKAAVTKPSAPVPSQETFEEEQNLQRLLQDVKREGMLASTPKIGSFGLLRKLSEFGSEPGLTAPEGESAPDPEVEAQKAQDASAQKEQDSQRKQDVHEQQLQFNEDKHELEMEKMRLDIQQEQETHQLKQQLEQEKMLAKQQGSAEQGAMPPMDPMQQQAQQQMQYQQNLMAKASAFYTDELEPINTSSAVPAMLTGTGIGGAAAHFIAPTEETKRYRELAKDITKEQEQTYRDALKRHGKKMPKDVRKQLFEPVADVSAKGNRVRFEAPASVRKRYFSNRALQSNAKRLVRGSGLGLLAGLASYYGMKE